jgi:hypothetical protein
MSTIGTFGDGLKPAKPKFKLGNIVTTPGAMSSIPLEEMEVAIRRHGLGDWGDVDSDDSQANDDALINGDRLLSSYRTKSGEKFWIITEWDRSVTTVLLPEEY